MKNHTIINIGRQFGSGGRRIAEVLGQKLGIPVFDNEILAKAAEQSGYSKDLFKKGDEDKHFFTFSNFLGNGTRYSFNENYLNDNELFRLQSEAIQSIAEQGPAIFVGRASDYVLREYECLNVFITAPMEVRKKDVSERENVSIGDAEAIINKKDKKREAYYNFYTFGYWGVASNYDLCLDSSILGIEGTADFIIDFGKKSGLIK